MQKAILKKKTIFFVSALNTFCFKRFSQAWFRKYFQGIYFQFYVISFGAQILKLQETFASNFAKPETYGFFKLLNNAINKADVCMIVTIKQLSTENFTLEGLLDTV